MPRLVIQLEHHFNGNITHKTNCLLIIFDRVIYIYTIYFHYRDSSINAGFNEGHKTWLPMSTNYKCINVKTEREEAVSHLSIYKKLVAIRKHLVGASFTSNVFNDSVLTYERLVIMNPIEMNCWFQIDAKSYEIHD